MSNALRQRADRTIPAKRIRYEFQVGIHCWIYLLSLEVSTIGLCKSDQIQDCYKPKILPSNFLEFLFRDFWHCFSLTGPFKNQPWVKLRSNCAFFPHYPALTRLVF